MILIELGKNNQPIIEKTIIKIPEQIRTGAELGKNFKFDKKYERIILCGMGGSIIAGEILHTFQSIKDSDQLSVFINRDYGLPDWLGKNDLIICISWSGNTEETISSYKAASDKELNVVAITKEGGKLAEMAENKILLPDEEIPPRLAVGYIVGALFGFLNMGEELNFELNAGEMKKEGQDIATKINNKTPLIYSAFKWRKLANFWKVLFNENAKIHAFWNSFPALCHNEIAGFEGAAKNYFPILIKNPADDGRQNADIDVAIAIFDKLGYNYNIVNLSTSDKLLEKIIKNYILGLWTSFYLAKNLGIDPEAVKLIEEFKGLKK